MAIYGHETSYGAVTGGFDLLDALATLAYEGRRRALFESEFVAALKLIDTGIPRWRLKGSWAGRDRLSAIHAVGRSLRLRADGDGDGYANIWVERGRRSRVDRQLSSRRRVEAGRAVGRCRCACRRRSTAPRSLDGYARRAARASTSATADG